MSLPLSYLAAKVVLGSPALALAIIILAVSSIAFAYLTVTYRSLVYSSIFLAFVGLINAAFFMILGYPLLAFIQLIIYVGAGVVFIVVSISMLKEPKIALRPLSYSWIVVIFIFLLVLAVSLTVGLAPSYIAYLGVLRTVSFIDRYWFADLILIFALAVALIASITISRGEEE